MRIVLFLHLEEQWGRWESFGSSLLKISFLKKERGEGDRLYYP